MIEPADLQPEFSVILPFRDPLPEFRDCLNAILQEVQRYGSAEIIAVDHGSQDKSADLVRAHPSIRLISAPHKSIGGLRNTGAGVARGHYLYFLDADCVVSESQFIRATGVFAETGCSATGCKVGLSPDPSWVERTWVRMHQPVTDGPVSYINSGNIFVTSHAFRDVGGFDETLVTSEDVEFGLRLNARGHTVFQSTALSVSHLGNPKTLRTLLRKEIWHGLGMLGTSPGLRINRLAAMTIMHVVLAVCSIALLVFSELPVTERIGLILAGNVTIPLISVGYRYHQNRLGGGLLARVILYWVYYLGRAIALFRIAVGRTAGLRS